MHNEPDHLSRGSPFGRRPGSADRQRSPSGFDEGSNPPGNEPDLDVALDRLLAATPCPEVGSNFSARVRQAMELERNSGPQRLKGRPGGSWVERIRLRIAWQVAIGTAAVLLAGGWWQWNNWDRQQVARRAVETGRLVSGTMLSTLQDFDPIRLAAAGSPSDDPRLMAALSD